MTHLQVLVIYIHLELSFIGAFWILDVFHLFSPQRHAHLSLRSVAVMFALICNVFAIYFGVEGVEVLLGQKKSTHICIWKHLFRKFSVLSDAAMS